jgi:hypothetical protein
MDLRAGGEEQDVVEREREGDIAVIYHVEP